MRSTEDLPKPSFQPLDITLNASSAANGIRRLLADSLSVSDRLDFRTLVIPVDMGKLEQ